MTGRDWSNVNENKTNIGKQAKKLAFFLEANDLYKDRCAPALWQACQGCIVVMNFWSLFARVRIMCQAWRNTSEHLVNEIVSCKAASGQEFHSF